MSNDLKALGGVKARIEGLLRDRFQSKTLRLAKASGVGESTLRHWLTSWDAGKAINPNTMALFKVAQACGVTVEWLLTGEEPEPQREAPDHLELARLREDLSSALVRIENLTNQLAEATHEGTGHARRVLELSQEIEKLKAEPSTHGLGTEEMADVEDIHRALGLRGLVDVSQVLHVAATSFRAVTRENCPPGDEQGDAEIKREGGQGGKAVRSRRATSSR